MTKRKAGRCDCGRTFSTAQGLGAHFKHCRNTKEMKLEMDGSDLRVSYDGTETRYDFMPAAVDDRADRSAMLKAYAEDPQRTKAIPCLGCGMIIGHTESCKAFWDKNWKVPPAGKPPPSTYEDIGRSIGALVEKKQAAYGDSFGKSGAVMRILYPDGISIEKLDDALTVVRVLDKLFRIATARDALGESPWQDIAGYAVLSQKRLSDRVAK